MQVQKYLKIKSFIISFNEDSVIVGNRKSIEVFSYENEKKDEIKIDERFGEIKSFTTQGKFLLVITKKNFFGVFI